MKNIEAASTTMPMRSGIGPRVPNRVICSPDLAAAATANMRTSSAPQPWMSSRSARASSGGVAPVAVGLAGLEPTTYSL